METRGRLPHSNKIDTDTEKALTIGFIPPRRAISGLDGDCSSFLHYVAERHAGSSSSFSHSLSLHTWCHPSTTAELTSIPRSW